MQSPQVKELHRGVRTHFARFVKSLGLDGTVLEKAQLGLGHAYSRNKMQFDPNRQVRRSRLWVRGAVGMQFWFLNTAR